MGKRTLWTLVAVLSFCGNILAQTDVKLDDNAMYFTKDELPNAVKFLPAPPDTTSVAFNYDILQYMWGKEQRQDSLRTLQAIDNAVEEIPDMLAQFSVPFGMELSKEKTPAIYHVVHRGVFSVRLAASKPKITYQRLRPFARFDEHTIMPAGEERLRSNGSYPSGHTVRGWTMTLLLMEINPDAQDELLAFGYEWGQSRVISGYHWQSDVDASRLVAAAGYSRLHTSQEFLDDMAAARKEFARLKANMHVVSKRK